MARAFGEIKLNISVPVENEDETMGLLEANYKLDPNIVISYELIAMDSKGKRHKIAVHNCDKMELVEFIG